MTRIIRFNTIEDEDIGVADDQIALIWWYGANEGTQITLKSGRVIMVTCDAGDLMVGLDALDMSASADFGEDK